MNSSRRSEFIIFVCTKCILVMCARGVWAASRQLMKTSALPRLSVIHLCPIRSISLHRLHNCCFSVKKKTVVGSTVSPVRSPFHIFVPLRNVNCPELADALSRSVIQSSRRNLLFRFSRVTPAFFLISPTRTLPIERRRRATRGD